jgi:hypothetical protein
MTRDLDEERAESMADEGGWAGAVIEGEMQNLRGARARKRPVRLARLLAALGAIVGAIVFVPRFWRRRHT